MLNPLNQTDSKIDNIRAKVEGREVFIKSTKRTVAISSKAKIAIGAIILILTIVCFLKGERLRLKLNRLSTEKEKSTGIDSDYGRLQKYIFHVEGIIIPVYFEKNTDKKNFKKIIFDFTILASDHKIKSYFEDEERMYLIQDKINSTLSPTLENFPLEEEGKQIIKEKIKQEFNTLLKELKIDGTIQEVYIRRILAA